MNKGKQIRGSYTVETALLFPFLLMTVFAAIYLALYLRDKAVLYAMAGDMAQHYACVCNYGQGLEKEDINDWMKINRKNKISIWNRVRKNIQAGNNKQEKIIEAMNKRCMVVQIISCKGTVTQKKITFSIVATGSYRGLGRTLLPGKGDIKIKFCKNIQNNFSRLRKIKTQPEKEGSSNDT